MRLTASDRCHGLVGEVGPVFDQGRFRSELHERLHGRAGQGKADGFQQLRQREQERYRRAFRPLMDQQRTEHGDGHEHVHVQREALQRPPSLGHGEPTACDDGDAIGDIDHQLRRELQPLDEHPQAKG